MIKENIEDEIINKSIERYNSNDHNYIDYKHKVCLKPWGYEFLCLESDKIGMWFLNIKYNNGTSFHCHLEKDTFIIVIEGIIEIELIDKKIILQEFETIFIEKRKFHAIKSLFDNSKLLEIEIYTNNTKFSDKNDLIRFKDELKRYDNIYINSIKFADNNEDYDYFLLNEINKKNINKNIIFEIIKPVDIVIDIESLYILLEGTMRINNYYVNPGSIIDNSNFSILNNNIKILKISYDNLVESKKIIKNNEHLDYILNKHIHFNKILTSGCFDIFHKGHLKILREAKKMGDMLFVCVSNDEQIKYLKGEDRPINNLDDRISVLKSISFIDYIIPYIEVNYIEERTLDDIIIKINPQYWIKGNDYLEEKIRLLHPSINKIKLIPLENNVSSTQIINKIKNN